MDTQYHFRNLNNNSKVELLNSISLKQQIEFIDNIGIYDNTEESLYALFEFLKRRLISHFSMPGIIDALAYQKLKESLSPEIQKMLNAEFNDGIINLITDSGISYTDLHDSLINCRFQDADKLTHSKLCALAQILDTDRKWLYFSDISKIPVKDILLIDHLWFIYSRGKFGFSAQRKVWLGVNKNWDHLWLKLGWKKGLILCRYPTEFIWSVNAPIGHLPLFNQLRGNQVLNTLFNLDIWN